MKENQRRIFILSVLFFAGCTNAELKSSASVTVPDADKALQFNFIQTSTSTGLFVDKPYNLEQGYGFDFNTQINNKPKPFYFSATVPEGNYRVTVEFGHSHLSSSNTVKAESRRLFLQDVKTRPGKFITRNFIVNVRNTSLIDHGKDSPTSEKVLLKRTEIGSLTWDDKLTLEFNGAAPQVRSVKIEKVNVPTIYLIGDSTVTDQAFEPAASWGQMLPVFFKDTVAVSNHAESGETMKAFIMELRLAKVLETIKRDDYLFIQFGHNDQKKQWPQTYVEAETTYKEYLKTLIAEAQLRGAIPVLITSMQRRNFDQLGKIQNTHGKYPDAVRELAKEMNVALIDLEAMSVKLYEALGPTKAPLAFNDNGKDLTHHNNYGAYELAKCVVEGIRAAQLPLAAQLLNGLPHFDPASPDPVENFNLSPSPAESRIRPAEN